MNNQYRDLHLHPSSSSSSSDSNNNSDAEEREEDEEKDEKKEGVKKDTPPAASMSLFRINPSDDDNPVACIVCYLIYPPPWEGCRFCNRVICSRCYTKLTFPKECPSCRASIVVKTRFRIMERALEHWSITLEYKCPNDGCDQRLSLEMLESHKSQCLFQPSECPAKSPHKCNFQGSRKTILDHYVSNHAAALRPIIEGSVYLNPLATTTMTSFPFLLLRSRFAAALAKGQGNLFMGTYDEKDRVMFYVTVDLIVGFRGVLEITCTDSALCMATKIRVSHTPSSYWMKNRFIFTVYKALLSERKNKDPIVIRVSVTTKPDVANQKKKMKKHARDGDASDETYTPSAKEARSNDTFKGF
jgi:hypothetical protein